MLKRLVVLGVVSIVLWQLGCQERHPVTAGAHQLPTNAAYIFACLVPLNEKPRVQKNPEGGSFYSVEIGGSIAGVWEGEPDPACEELGVRIGETTLGVSAVLMQINDWSGHSWLLAVGMPRVPIPQIGQQVTLRYFRSQSVFQGVYGLLNLTSSAGGTIWIGEGMSSPEGYNLIPERPRNFRFEIGNTTPTRDQCGTIGAVTLHAKYAGTTTIPIEKGQIGEIEGSQVINSDCWVRESIECTDTLRGFCRLAVLEPFPTKR